jgi:YHS domain-containing protein
LTVTYQGAVYHFSGNEPRTLFLANPEQFVPANGGNDPVILANERRSMPGELNYCAAFKGRIYMFRSAATQAEFQKSPERYAGSQPSENPANRLSDAPLGSRGYQTLSREYNSSRTGF